MKYLWVREGKSPTTGYTIEISFIEKKSPRVFVTENSGALFILLAEDG
jgi:hypothetical protein